MLPEPTDQWVARHIELLGNAHPNDGRKIAALIASSPVALGSRIIAP
jgi:hypothetical protein